MKLSLLPNLTATVEASGEPFGAWNMNFPRKKRTKQMRNKNKKIYKRNLTKIKNKKT